MDLRIDNPVGRVPDASRMSSVHLGATSEGWSLGRRTGRWHDAWKALDGLDDVHGVFISGTSDVPSTLAHFVHRAAARGTLVAGDLSPAVTSALPAGLASRIPKALPDSVAGELAWDVCAVRQRRHALRAAAASTPTVSAVLVSRRPDRVEQAVTQLARQTYENLEIVVGLHGVPAPSGLSAAAAQIPLTVLEIDASVVFGDALNAAFGAAGGQWLTKVDDDDYYGPDHVWDLVLAKSYSGATLVGKTTTVVYLDALDSTVRRVFGTRESFTHRVAGGTMLLSASDLTELGGWKPVPRAIDTELLRSVKDHGGVVYQPHDIGYLYARSESPGAHTWQADIAHFLRNVREQWVGLLRHPEFGTSDIRPL